MWGGAAVRLAGRGTGSGCVHDNGQTFLRLGDPPVPVPEPFADVLISYVNARSNLTTATNPDLIDGEPHNAGESLGVKQN
jgi:hypothetical protein